MSAKNMFRYWSIGLKYDIILNKKFMEEFIKWTLTLMPIIFCCRF